MNSWLVCRTASGTRQFVGASLSNGRRMFSSAICAPKRQEVKWIKSPRYLHPETAHVTMICGEVLDRFSELGGPYAITFEDLKMNSFEAERNSFLEMKHTLLSDPRYQGKYVAVRDGLILDVDDDKVELAKRVYDKHGYVPIYIDRVQEKARIYEIPSPEIRRK